MPLILKIMLCLRNNFLWNFVWSENRNFKKMFLWLLNKKINYLLPSHSQTILYDIVCYSRYQSRHCFCLICAWISQLLCALWTLQNCLLAISSTFFSWDWSHSREMSDIPRISIKRVLLERCGFRVELFVFGSKNDNYVNRSIRNFKIFIPHFEWRTVILPPLMKNCSTTVLLDGTVYTISLNDKNIDRAKYFDFHQQLK